MSQTPASADNRTDAEHHAADHRYIRARRLRREWLRDIVRDAVRASISHLTTIGIVALLVALSNTLPTAMKGWINDWLLGP